MYRLFLIFQVLEAENHQKVNVLAFGLFEVWKPKQKPKLKIVFLIFVIDFLILEPYDLVDIIDINGQPWVGEIECAASR